jgi:hypothetical protein
MINFTYLKHLFIMFTLGFPLPAFLTVDLETNSWLKRWNPIVAQGHYLRFWGFTFDESNCAYGDYGYLVWRITCYISCDSAEIVQRLRLSLRDSIIFLNFRVSFYRTVLRLSPHAMCYNIVTIHMLLLSLILWVLRTNSVIHYSKLVIRLVR